jgi:hypothetical protein
MGVYKKLKSKDFSFKKIKLHKTFNLNTGSSGINAINYISGSVADSGSYWDSLRINYYLSGSSLATTGWSSQVFNNPFHSFGLYDIHTPQHKNKFHSSGSVISITQQYFGETIKHSSFTLTDKSNIYDKEVIIKDDGYGNLYSTNASISSSNNSISSSDNYIGNIFYNTGIITITDTGSWSGSIKYTDVATQNYSVAFQSTNTLYIQEYNINIKGTELNGTNNPTAKSGSNFGVLANHLTSSGWSPYITTIGLYDDDKNLLVTGRISQPVKKIKWGDLTFKLRFDI